MCKLNCDLFHIPSDLNGVIMSYFLYTEFIKSVVPVCKRMYTWFLNHKHAYQLSLAENAPDVFLHHPYVRMVQTTFTSLPCLSHLEHLELDPRGNYVTLNSITSDTCPRLTSFTLFMYEVPTFGKLSSLITLTLHCHKFVFEDTFINPGMVPNLERLNLHGHIHLYQTELGITRLDIETSHRYIMVHCTPSMHKLSVIVNPRLNPLGCPLWLPEMILINKPDHLTSVTAIGQCIKGLEMCRDLESLYVLESELPLHTYVNCVKPAVICNQCYAVLMEAKSCGKCGRVKYCSGRCQVDDWAEHKLTCRS